MMCFSMTLLPVPLRPSTQQHVPAGMSSVTSSSTVQVAERLGHALERDGRRRRARHWTSGKRKKMSRTSTTLTTMSSTDDMTTLCVAARPTPSVPPVVVRPW